MSSGKGFAAILNRNTERRKGRGRYRVRERETGSVGEIMQSSAIWLCHSRCASSSTRDRGVHHMVHWDSLGAGLILVQKSTEPGGLAISAFPNKSLVCITLCLSYIVVCTAAVWKRVVCLSLSLSFYVFVWFSNLPGCSLHCP